MILALCAVLVMCDPELVAIRWHMGPWSVNMENNDEKMSFKAAQDKFALVTIIQVADTLAARIIER